MLSKEVKLRRAINRHWHASYASSEKASRKTVNNKAALVRLIRRALDLGISQRMLLGSQSSAKRYGWSSAQVANVDQLAERAMSEFRIQSSVRKVLHTQRELREIGII